MDLWDLKKWRRKLRYSQFDAARELGVGRAAVQYWESERVPISEFVELACEELTRRWKQRPELGPVTLMYASEPVWPGSGQPTRRLFVQCELYANSELALQRACWLKQAQNLMNLFIVNEDAEIVWAGPELLNECDRRRENVPDTAPEPPAASAGDSGNDRSI